MKSLVGVVAFGLASILGVSAVSAAECEDSTAQECTVEVEAVGVVPPAGPSAPSVAPVQVAGKQQLPVTGSEAGLLGLVGASLLTGGALLVVRSKNDSATA